jgi:hypothetical protein
MRTFTPIALALCMLHAAVCHAVVHIQPNPITGQNYTQVLFNGSTQLRFDLVFIGDGFTESQQADFNARVDDAVAALKARQPYARRMCAFNVWRVNVISSESGIDHPVQNTLRDTELDCRYGNPASGEPERCITSDFPIKCFQAANNAPANDAIVVLVNDIQPGGCAKEAVYSSIAADFGEIITHELGHKIGALADEYECYVCAGADANRTHVGPEPIAANITTILDRTTTKWASRINSSTSLPTTSNNPPGVVGLWEGGGYYAHAIYRPQEQCQMRTLNVPFCAVCEAAMDMALSAHCTPSELSPPSGESVDMDLLRRTRLVWRTPIVIRRPLPPCLTCPPHGGPERVVLRVSGAPAGFSMRVLDDRGNVVARDDFARDGLSVTFDADPAHQYVTDLVGENPTGRQLDLVTELTRNGRRQALR